MTGEGHVVLFRFPQTDQSVARLRPALVLRHLPGPHDDWLICMISTRLHQQIAEFDEVIREGDDDFELSGLKQTSLIRISRIAVVHGGILLGAIGRVVPQRLLRIKKKLADWLMAT